MSEATKFLFVFFFFFALLTATFPEKVYADDALHKSVKDLPKSEMDDIPDPLRDKAKNGDAEAQCTLGSEYYFGKNRRKNYTLAAYWYSKAAQNEHPAATFNMALCYDQGLGVDKSAYKAFQCYKKAFELGVKEAKFNMALSYAYGIPADNHANTPPVIKNSELAEKYLLELVADNFIPAMRELGIFYLSDENASPDTLKNGFALEMRASDAGDPSAMRILADCYFDGLGCEKNENKMFECLQKAAAAGDAEGQAKLAFCYEFGNGTKQNPDQAFVYYQKAAKQGFDMALVKMGDYYALENSKYVEHDINKAIAFYKKAAEKHNAYALFKLGVFAYEGIGQTVDKKKAAEYFFESAKQGNPHAQYNIAIFFEEGKYIPADPGAAFYWFRQAALQNEPRSQTKLAYYYMQGIAVKADQREGLKWLTIAAENGEKDAQGTLEEAKKAFPESLKKNP